MQVNLVIGNNHFDILKKQMELVSSGLSNGHKQIFIVPDRFSLGMEKFVLESLGITASFDIEVYTFSRLASKSQDLSSKKVLSSLGATMIIQMLLEKYKTELKCFVHTARTIVFASILFDSISQLKSCQISPADLLSSAENQQDPALKAKMQDISFIYSKYENYLQNDYLDSSNKLKLLAETLPDNTILKNADVHFCHFDNMTEQGYDILLRMVKVANSVSCGALKAEKTQNNTNIFNEIHLNKILDICKRNSITPNILEVVCSLDKNRSQILSNVFAYEQKLMEIENHFLSLYQAGNPYAEVDFVAKDILRKIRTLGTRFRDININCTDLKTYAPLFKEVFSRFEIPFFIDLPFSANDSEAFKFVNAVFGAITSDFAIENVLKFIKNPITNLDSNSQAIFEIVAKRYSLDRNLIFKKLDGLGDDEEYNEFCNIVQNVLTPLVTFNKNISASKTIGEYCSSLDILMEEMQFDNRLNALADEASVNYDLINQSIYRQSIDKLRKIITEMHEIMAEFETEFETFVTIFNAGASGVTISPLPMSLDCVYVGQALQSVFESKKIMYLVGAVDGKLPAWVLDVGLITDNDIENLEKQKVKIEPSITEINARSRLAVLQDLITFQTELKVLYPLNINGEKCDPSTVIKDLSKIFTWQDSPIPIVNIEYLCANDNSAFGGEGQRLLFNWGNYDNMLRAIMESMNKETEIDRTLLATARKCLVDTGYKELIDNMKGANIEISISPDVAKNLFFGKGKVSVTEIEKYFNCPYLHFLEYGLKVKEPKTSQMDSLDIGTILHAVLENFTKVLRKEGNLKDNEISPLVENIFDEIISKPDFARLVATGQNKNMLSGLKNESVRACKAINYQQLNSKYKIKFIEESFGNSGFAPVPEIAVLNTDLKIKIKGKIDRVDCLGSKYRIIDYKSSKNAGVFNLVNFYIGKKIQLFYYAYAMLKGLKQQDESVSISGVYYLPVHREYAEEINISEYSGYKMDGVTLGDYSNLIEQDMSINFDKPKSDIIPFNISTKKEHIISQDATQVQNYKFYANSKQLEEMLNYSEKMITNAILELANGYISPKPIKSACEYCAYNNICRVACVNNKIERSDNFEVKVDSFGGLK